MATKNCPCCGKAIASDANFCLYCMTKFVDEENVETPKPRKSDSKKTAFIIIISAVLILALAAGVYLYLNKKDKSSGGAADIYDNTYRETLSAQTTADETLTAKSGQSETISNSAYERLSNNQFKNNLLSAVQNTSSGMCFDESSLNFSYASDAENFCSLKTIGETSLTVKYCFDGSKISVEANDIFGEEKLGYVKEFCNILLKSFSGQYSDMQFKNYIASTDNLTEKSENIYYGSGEFDGYSCRLKLDKSSGLYSFYIEFSKT